MLFLQTLYWILQPSIIESLFAPIALLNSITIRGMSTCTVPDTFLYFSKLSDMLGHGPFCNASNFQACAIVVGWAPTFSPLCTLSVLPALQRPWFPYVYSEIIHVDSSGAEPVPTFRLSSQTAPGQSPSGCLWMLTTLRSSRSRTGLSRRWWTRRDCAVPAVERLGKIDRAPI